MIHTDLVLAYDDNKIVINKSRNIEVYYFSDDESDGDIYIKKLHKSKEDNLESHIEKRKLYTHKKTTS